MRQTSQKERNPVDSARTDFSSRSANGTSRQSIDRHIIVGRDQELATLDQLRLDAFAGSGRLVLISGEAGIGKSTLARSVVERALLQNAVVLSGASYDLSATPPYGLWLDLIRHYPHANDLPELPPFMTDGEELQALSGQEVLHAKSAEFFRQVAEIRPLLIVLEDVHWADQPSLEFLRYIARTIDTSPMLIVVTYRDNEVVRGQPLFQIIPALVREASAERIELRPLSTWSIRKLISSGYELPREDLNALSIHLNRWSEGNPLFLQECLRTLEIDGILSKSDEGWAVGDLQAAVVPNLIRQMIESRLYSIEQQPAEAIQVASVIGQKVPLTLWETFFSPESLEPAIPEGIARGLIRESPDLPGIEFSHALVREAIHATIPMNKRRALHRQLAESFIQQSRPDPEAIAYHLKQAGDARSAEWLIAAGEQAERRLTWEEAFSRYNEALEILENSVGEESTVAGLLLKTARLLRFEDPEKANGYLEAAMEVAKDCGDKTLAAAAEFNHGNNLCNLGEVRRGMAEMTRAIEVLTTSPEEAERISRWSQTSLPARPDPIQAWLGLLSLILSTIGRFREAIEFGERSLRQEWKEVRNTGISDLLSSGTHTVIDAYEGIAMAKAALGKPEDAHFAFHLSHELHERVKYGPLRVLVASAELLMHHFPYRTTELHERQRLIDVIEDHLQFSAGIVGNQNALWAYEHYLLHTGKWDELREHIRCSVRPTSYDYRFVSRTARARLAWYEGKFVLAWKYIDDLLPDGPGSPPDDHIHIQPGELHRIAIGLSIDEGKLDLARGWLAAHTAWLDWSNTVLGRPEGLLLEARLTYLEGMGEEATEIANRALEVAHSPPQPFALIGIRRFLGELSLAMGSPELAMRHLTSSLHLAEACQFPYEQAKTLVTLAAVHTVQGDQDRAEELLRSARNIAQSLGAQPLTDHIDEVKRSTRKQPHEKPYGLSPRELEVLSLIARGMTDRQIGDHLFISPRTVMQHVTRILRKLEVDSRTAAAARALQDGIFDLPADE
jgi:DNA-binding CsgD family transcriptional regulator